MSGYFNLYGYKGSPFGHQQDVKQQNRLPSHRLTFKCKCRVAMINAEDDKASTGEQLDGSFPVVNNSIQSARIQLERLQQAREESKQALEQIQNNNNHSGSVDVRMYDQLRNSRNRLGKKLSEANQYASFLESSQQQGQDDVTTAYDFVSKLYSEFGGLARSLESVSGSAQYGLDKLEALKKLEECVERFQNCQIIAEQYKNQLHHCVTQKVTIRWCGVASEVRVMGDFDNWTKGQELSREDASENSDRIFGNFQTDLALRPGVYRMKLLVDGKWQLAQDWPSEIDQENKETNNIITVE